MRPVPAFVASAVLGWLPSSDLRAQVQVPDGFQLLEADNNTAFPWGRGAQQTRVLYVHAAAHFLGQGVDVPVVIDRLRWRADGGDVRPGYVLNHVVVRLSTAAVRHTAPLPVFDANHGADVQTAFVGPVVVATPSGAAPNDPYVDLPIAPFAYDPTQGDLAIELAHDGSGPLGTSGPLCDAVVGDAALAGRVFHGTDWQAATGTVQTSFCPVLEVDYHPAAGGIVASFWAGPRSGPSPLQVDFHDLSRSANGAVAQWSWDFDGDGTVDSNAQHPSHTFATCGSYDVTLTVRAAAGSDSFTRTVYVVTDEIRPDFTMTRLPAAAPGTVRLVDATTPPATAWAWDFDGDGQVDSRVQDPVVQLPLCQLATVRLDATRLCRSEAVARSFFVAGDHLDTPFAANNNGLSGWGLLFDLTVLESTGISICGLDANTGTTPVGTPFSIDVFVTDGSAAADQNDASRWRLVGTATGTAAGLDVPSAAALPQPLRFAPGSYGLALYHNGCSPRYLASGAPMTVANADLQLDLGVARSTPFGQPGLVFSPRVWSGAIHYDTCRTGALAGFGWSGPGCGGTLSPSQQRALALPRSGSVLQLEFDRLPQSAAIVMMGFDADTSPLGPLPIDLAALGAPGCFGRVDPAIAWFAIGSGGIASLAVPIPADPVFACLPFFTQGLVFDAGANALGMVVSDAAAGVIGL
ncbi:MAG: PKD domain-containing protein [Planctomycetota bacterium]